MSYIKENLSGIIIAVVLSALATIAFIMLLEFSYKYKIKSSFELLQSTLTMELKNEDIVNLKTCDLMLEKNNIYEKKEQELMLSSEWLGLSSDITDCSFSIMKDVNPYIMEDGYRIILESIDNTVALKMIWKDIDGDGKPDSDVSKEKNYKDTIEEFLVQSFKYGI